MRKSRSLDERFWEKVQKSPGCWNWTASTRAGYGGIKIRGKNKLAHRVSYEMIVATIPDDLTIDHLCKNKLCVNPAHMEVVSLSENVKRAQPWLKSALTRGAHQSAKVSCPNGHPYDYTSPNGKRGCKTCRRATYRRHYDKI